MKRFTILWNILIMIAISALILIGVIQGLKVYTKQGDIIEVPSLKGKSIEQALKILEQNSLSAEVVDSIYQRNKPVNSIYDVVPEEGSKVKSGRTIFLRIYSSTPTQKALPDVQDLPLRAAQERLKRLGFIHFTEKEVEGLHKGLCVGIENKDGKLLEAGKRVSVESKLVLLVSGKATETLTVEDLINSEPNIDVKTDSLDIEPTEAKKQEEQPDNWF